MIGFLIAVNRSQTANGSNSSNDNGVSPNISSMSAPAANALSLPLTTMTRMVSSLSKASACSSISSTIVLFYALATFGCFNWMMPIHLSVEYLINYCHIINFLHNYKMYQLSSDILYIYSMIL